MNGRSPSVDGVSGNCAYSARAPALLGPRRISQIKVNKEQEPRAEPLERNRWPMSSLAQRQACLMVGLGQDWGRLEATDLWKKVQAVRVLADRTENMFRRLRDAAGRSCVRGRLGGAGGAHGLYARAMTTISSQASPVAPAALDRLTGG